MHGSLITKVGLARLRAELERLKTDGRRSVAERLKQAAGSQANRAENADYLQARSEQAVLEHRIAVLEQRLRSAQLVEPRLGNGRIDVGERVRVHDLTSGEQLELRPPRGMPPTGATASRAKSASRSTLLNNGSVRS
jgi:transcription elongation factor GreA